MRYVDRNPRIKLALIGNQDIFGHYTPDPGSDQSTINRHHKN